MKITKKKIILAVTNLTATIMMLLAALAAFGAFGGLFMGAYAWSAGLFALAVVLGLLAVKVVIAIDNYEYPIK